MCQIDFLTQSAGVRKTEADSKICRNSEFEKYLGFGTLSGVTLATLKGKILNFTKHSSDKHTIRVCFWLFVTF